MRFRLPVTLIILLLCFSSAAAKDDITKELITSSGKTRPYYLYVPSTIKSNAPLIIMLHGSNRTGVTLVEKWKDYAKKEGIILAGPDASNLRGWGSPQDGPDFLRDLVEELKTKYPVNPRRVYLFGHSAGAVFAIEMSLMESQYFAAVAIHQRTNVPRFTPISLLPIRFIDIEIAEVEWMSIRAEVQNIEFMVEEWTELCVYRVDDRTNVLGFSPNTFLIFYSEINIGVTEATESIGGEEQCIAGM